MLGVVPAGGGGGRLGVRDALIDQHIRITDSGRITGRFTRQEAQDLAIVLRAGALPAPIIVEEERTVGPTLGRDSIEAGLRAILMGAALVVTIMLLLYWLAGAVAVVCLSFNLLLILAGLGYLPGATLTLPGIAGMILTLGMAVDANVLIYERIREELRGGRPLSLSIASGYEKAARAIVGDRPVREFLHQLLVAS